MFYLGQTKELDVKLLVTGSTGFVGGALLRKLSTDSKFNTTAAFRKKISERFESITYIQVGDLGSDSNWKESLKGVVTVIHTAARVHVMNEKFSDPLFEYRKVNVDGTLSLARQAASSGVRRFIFISSIKVNGEQTEAGHPFTADNIPEPSDPYAISKYEAEIGLNRLANETGMEIVIIRPPLVYGPGVKGNFQSMIKMIEKRVPLPLGAIYNKRSLVGLDNLLDLIVTCIDHPAAANQVFLAGDGEDLSTTELLRWLGMALGKPARLIPLPESLLTFLASCMGKKSVIQRLCGSLQVDISKEWEVLGWVPPITVAEGIRRAVENFKE